MGWFDESDSEENDATNPPPTLGPTAGQNDGDDDDEEEDPLDAYMNSLADCPDQSSRQCRGGRLDHDAEDEATSHWEVSKRPVSATAASSGSSRLLPPSGFRQHDDDNDLNAEEDEGEASSSRDARLAMSNTFVRAGGNKQTQPDKGAHVDHDDSFDDATLERMARQHQYEMQHQEIAPLEKINHESVRYRPFRRVFFHALDTEGGAAWRKGHTVTCVPPVDPIVGFDQEIFPEELIKRIAKSGYDSPTLVQCQTLPVALAGKDALITAATGSGKTLAYLWPIVIHVIDQPHINPGTDGPIALILTPTRELSKQVSKYAKLYMEPLGGKAVEVSGGNKGTWELCKELKRGCEIVVGTPGRVIDVVRKKGTNLERVTFVVLDEADRMLDMGFEKQVSSILENIRPDRQTLLLSATFGKRVERVARGWLKNPVRIAIGRTGSSSEHVDQHVMVLPSAEAKRHWLVEMLPILAPLGRCIVFVATRADCDLLTSAMENSPAFRSGESIIVSIHGDKDQSDRNSAISQFKKNPNAVMIATDVASRGLDIPDVMTVINFDAAKNMDSHVHRVGRAGRMSKTGKDDTSGEHYQQGVAYTLLTEHNADFAQSLVEAFEREGRSISQELIALCQKSKRYGGGRKKQSKGGLGFGASDSSSYRNEKKDHGVDLPNHPSAKKSRWG
eukprot:CCRYP_003913-RA/>CCRYP_003913-RA protein AED:0.14 eAED:0.14 QI:626/1/0.75/1/1/1/4/0/674